MSTGEGVRKPRDDPIGVRIDILAINGATLLANIGYRPYSLNASGWTWGNGTAFSSAFDADGRVTSESVGTVQRSYG